VLILPKRRRIQQQKKKNMGTWTAKIEDNDDFLDVYDEFFNLYNQGLEPDEIKDKLKNEFSETLKLSENNFWFALAKGFWECQQEDNEVQEHLNELILNGKDLEINKHLNADDNFLQIREEELQKFIKKISTRKPKPKTRKKLKKPIFKTGQYWTFLLGDYYYAFVVLKEIHNEFGENLIAILNYEKIKKPAFEEIEKSQIVYYEVEAFVQSDEPKFLVFKNDNQNVYSASILLIDNSTFSKQEIKKNFELIGMKEINVSLSSKNTYYHHCGNNLIQLTKKIFESKQLTERIPIEL
jgi:hypothetical protein